MKLDLNLVLYFVAVAEEASFRRAAERLRIAQPWLTRRVKKLEYLLGFDLFVRTTRRVDLTDKGRKLLAQAQMLAREAEGTMALLDNLKRETPSQLLVGMPMWAIYIEAREKLFENFVDKYPNISIIPRSGSFRDTSPELLNGKLDALFTAAFTPTNGLESLTLCEGHVDILLPADDPLVRKKSVSIGDIAEREIAAFQRQSHPKLFREIFGAFEDRKLKLVEYPNLGFTRHIEEARSITALPSWVRLMRPGIARRPLEGSHKIKLELVRRRGPQSALMENFWRMAKQLAAKNEVVADALHTEDV